MKALLVGQGLASGKQVRDGTAPQGLQKSGEIALSLRGAGMEWTENFYRCKEESEDGER